MVTATVLAVFLVPVFFVTVRRMFVDKSIPQSPEPGLPSTSEASP
jgi:hypothetical protein